MSCSGTSAMQYHIRSNQMAAMSEDSSQRSNMMLVTEGRKCGAHHCQGHHPVVVPKTRETDMLPVSVVEDEGCK